MAKYIYQHENWINFTWDYSKIAVVLGEVRNLQGKLLGTMNTLGFSLKSEAMLETLTLDIMKSSEIEGEKLNRKQVRSSIAKRLGLEVGGLESIDRNVEGVVEMLLDATQNYTEDLSEDRLFGWHSALFPSGRSGMYKIEVGKYRTGEMQVVSGAMGLEKVHYEAIEAKNLKVEMDKFIHWINEKSQIDLVIKSAIAHLWFVTIHPFDDGNGRMARAISDMLLARSDGSSQRFYSMSNQILKERKRYYSALEKTQHGDSDITFWLNWFLNCLKSSLLNTEVVLKSVFRKAKFGEKHKDTQLNERQRFVINRLFDNFHGKLTSSKWAKMTKTSSDTALRDIKDLIEKGILKQDEAGGRSTNYELIIEDEITITTNTTHPY
ncbi:MAG: Fic family protein [Bacteroidetes bacterium]|nr:Fic family protein [Bacteroidota bacterium]MCL2303066.1 Fic family protein [Lentimicrobiaceae bacterium]